MSDRSRKLCNPDMLGWYSYTYKILTQNISKSFSKKFKRRHHYRQNNYIVPLVRFTISIWNHIIVELQDLKILLTKYHTWTHVYETTIVWTLDFFLCEWTHRSRTPQLSSPGLVCYKTFPFSSLPGGKSYSRRLHPFQSPHVFSIRWDHRTL